MSDFVFATAQYDSGDWDSAPLLPANVIDSVARYTSIHVAPTGVIVLSAPALFRYPLVYLTGHLPVRFTTAERDNLRAFAERGGMLFVDDHNHDVDGVFHKTATEELARVYGPLREIPNRHPLYRCFFTFDDGATTSSTSRCPASNAMVGSHCCTAARITARSGTTIRTTSGSCPWTTRSSP